MNSIFSSIRSNYKTGDGFTKLLYINLSFFIAYTIIWLPYRGIEEGVINYLAFPSETEALIYRPWTILSYMFVHKDLFHILPNMICLYFGARLFLQHFSSKQLITTYILGGICGAILFKIIFNIFPESFDSKNPLIGGSAGIFSIIIAIASYIPNHSIQLPLIGHVRLKYIAWISVLLFYIGVGDAENPGGYIAHLGGAIFGYFYIRQKGKAYSLGFNNFLNKLVNTFKTKSKLKTVHKRPKSDKQFNTEKTEQQKAINLVLEKISKSGYESLSKEEKNILFQESKK